MMAEHPSGVVLLAYQPLRRPVRDPESAYPVSAFRWSWYAVRAQPFYRRRPAPRFNFRGPRFPRGPR